MGASDGVSAERWLERAWYGRATGGAVLIPLGWLFRALAALRRLFYRSGVLRSGHPGVPLVVVGNIHVGGTGKTPFVLWLIGELKQLGLRPAIVSRGYGAQPGPEPRQVCEPFDAQRDGDEPVLLAGASGVPVFIGRDRLAAARAARAAGADVIVSDDGLQHYRMQRDLEIVLVDRARGFGNGRCLPAGPLREPVARLGQADLVIGHEETLPAGSELAFALEATDLQSLDGGSREELRAWHGRRVTALAAIGHPQRFFRQLARAGLQVDPVALPDHAPLEAYPPLDGAAQPIVVTEKDAVKLRGARVHNVWYLPVRAVLTAAASRAVRERLNVLRVTV